MATTRPDTEPDERSQRERRLNDIGWGLLLMLTGAVWVMPSDVLPHGAWLFGVAAILIGVNVARYLAHLTVSSFSLALGLAALAAALSQTQRAEPPLVAIFLLVTGGSIVFRAASRKTHHRHA